MPELIGKDSQFTPPSAFGVNVQGMTEQKNLLAALDAWKYLQLLMTLFYWIAGWFAISISVFLRRGFGERYLSWINLYCGYTVMATVVFFGDITLSFTGVGNEGSGMVLLFMYFGFIALSLYHRFVIFMRNRKGGLWYSYSGGTAWPVLYAPLTKITGIVRYVIPPPFRPDGLSREAYDKFVEPLLVLIVAFTLLSGAAKVWCIVAGLSLAFRAMMEYHQLREQLLDQIDAKLVGQHMSEAIKHQEAKPEQTEGVMVPRSTARLIKTAAKRFPVQPAAAMTNGQASWMSTPPPPPTQGKAGQMDMAVSP